MNWFFASLLFLTVFLFSCESKAGSPAVSEPRTTQGVVSSLAISRKGEIVGISLEESDRQAMEKYPQTLNKIEKGEPLSIEDVKKMSKAGLSDDVIIDQINFTNSAFYLNTTDIIGLKKAKVSQRVIDYMVQSGNR